MGKTSNLYTRIEPEVKAEAEVILKTLGISASSAINMFYKQIILHKGLPFEVKLPSHPLDITNIGDDKLNAELEKGYKDLKNGNTQPVSEVFNNIRGEYY